MGTNYNAAVNVCECCRRPEHSWHIGKSFRTLRSYKYGYGPFGTSIKSFEDWQVVLSLDQVVIMDEYGVVQDKDDFIMHWRDRGQRDLSPEEKMYGGWFHDDRGYVLHDGEFS